MEVEQQHANILQFPTTQEQQANDFFSFSVYDFEAENVSLGEDKGESPGEVAGNIISFEAKRAGILTRKREDIVVDYGNMFTLFKANEVRIAGGMAALAANMQQMGCVCPHEGPESLSSHSSISMSSHANEMSTNNSLMTEDEEHVHCESCGADMKNGVCPKCSSKEELEKEAA